MGEEGGMTSSPFRQRAAFFFAAVGENPNRKDHRSGHRWAAEIHRIFRQYVVDHRDVNVIGRSAVCPVRSTSPQVLVGGGDF